MNFKITEINIDDAFYPDKYLLNFTFSEIKMEKNRYKPNWYCGSARCIDNGLHYYFAAIKYNYVEN